MVVLQMKALLSGQNIWPVSLPANNVVLIFFVPGEQVLKEMLGYDDADKSFDSLSSRVSDKTLRAIRDMGFTQMMEIQHKSIRPLLDGQ